MTKRHWPSDFDADERQLVAEVGLDAGPPVEECLPPSMLQGAAAGVLPDGLRAVVEAHVAVCSRCQALRDGLADLEPEGLTLAEEARIRARIAVASKAAAPARWHAPSPRGGVTRTRMRRALSSKSRELSQANLTRTSISGWRTCWRATPPARWPR